MKKLFALCSIVGGILFLSTIISCAQDFNYTGSVQSWTVPANGRYLFELYGAQGGDAGGGSGGYAKGEKVLNRGDVFYIYVGGIGATQAAGNGGGWNGGGNAGPSHKSGGGGGATDIRHGGQGLSNRIIVAGGGGGGEGGGRGSGGAGGGLNGESVGTAVGGNQTSGGAGATLGQGGSHPGDGSGGGGGYYGGGYASGDLAGAGGSSYIGGVEKGATTPGQRTGDGLVRVTLISAPPTINLSKSPTAYTKGNVTITSDITILGLTQYDFDFTGSRQDWTVPNTGRFLMELWGAQGGDAAGGGGGYVKGEKQFNLNEKIYLYIGGRGATQAAGSGGGWNGGGNAGPSHKSGGGGGATDIRYEGTTLSNRIIVAGGGGGGEGGSRGSGGAGGGLNGGSVGGATGGSQTSGGPGASLGQGGNHPGDGSGGGGGYYGGGYGAGDRGGGGGSSYYGGVENGYTLAGQKGGNGLVRIIGIDNVSTTIKKWTSGNQTIDYFDNGGNILSGNTFTVSSNGIYTVYVKGRTTGNEGIATIVVNNIDRNSPTIDLTASPTTITAGNVTITPVIADDLSGIAVKKWAIGDQTESYFTTSGTVLTTPTIAVSVNDTYTFYAKDNAGNVTVKTITIDNINDGSVPYIVLSASPTQPTTNPVTITATITPSTAAVTPIDFNYTGSVRTWTAPVKGRYKLEVWGAEGKAGFCDVFPTYPGKGGYSKGEININASQALSIYIGGQGNKNQGGYNGGGNGWIYNAMNYGGGGGGATDIRMNGTALANRIIVAGGGGGSDNGSNYIGCNTGDGGDAGGSVGQNGKSDTHFLSLGVGVSGTAIGIGNGGTQTSGCALGQGGSFSSSGYAGGGGGGGYYGGYGAIGEAGGGGGSSYIDGVENGNSIAGNQSMPAPSGGNETGHTGNGFARITILGNPIISQKWAAGSQPISYFSSNGMAFTGTTFTVNSNGIYTVYAKDAAGKEAVRTITIRNIWLTPTTYTERITARNNWSQASTWYYSKDEVVERLTVKDASNIGFSKYILEFDLNAPSSTTNNNEIEITSVSVAAVRYNDTKTALTYSKTLTADLTKLTVNVANPDSNREIDIYIKYKFDKKAPNSTLINKTLNNKVDISVEKDGTTYLLKDDVNIDSPIILKDIKVKMG